MTARVVHSAGFFADLRDAAGIPARDANVKWSVADSTVARIEGAFGQSVILRALRRGSTTVTARSHGKSGTGLLVVDSLPPPPPPGDSVATVEVTPSADTVAAGDSASFFAILRDANGNILSGRAVSWTVSDSSVARIEGAFGQTVVIRAVGAGFSLVTAFSEGKNGSGSMVVP
ncbi:MAG TPA: Ig-like domain-containing protein [Gemmatimonadales bacterium]|nr:Ig-like domain-containing protein [Gemmatimonadales bacterium]